MTGPPSFQSSPCNCRRNLAVKNFDLREKIGVGRAQFPTLVRTTQSGKPPLRTSPWSPRTAAHEDFQADVSAGLDKSTQVAPARPIPLAFDFLVMNPENISGHDVHTAGLHLEQFLAPFVLPGTRE